MTNKGVLQGYLGLASVKAFDDRPIPKMVVSVTRSVLSEGAHGVAPGVDERAVAGDCDPDPGTFHVVSAASRSRYFITIFVAFS